jgi:glucosamine--fructose-6-phosphate aminotransferase (isomerizing)
MCGIVGCISKENALDFLMESLGKLEYRGYDSWGTAVLNGHGIESEKRTGSIKSFSGRLGFEGTVGIGHTRWATHGAVTEENAHPHFSEDNKIAVVHNGIIGNYEKLKEQLMGEGYRFRSETDTEVIPHLIDREYKKGASFLDACRAAIDQLEGSYALGIMSSHELGKVYVAKNQSPVRIGVGDGEMFFGSDIIAFLDHTDKVITLENGDFAELTRDQIVIHNNGSKVERPIERIQWSRAMASKGAYEYFMLKEIYEQGTKIREASFQNEVELKRIADILRKRDNIFILGAGTSYHAGLLAKYKLSEFLPVQAELASEFQNFKNRVTSETGIIAISQSGETADLLSALCEIKDKDPYILSICNKQGSPLTIESDDVLFINSGYEIGVAATKSYTGQLVVLDLLYHSLKGDLEYGKRLIETIADSVDDIIDRSMGTLNELVEKYLYAKDFYFIGRGPNYPTALEGALKLKEISYAHAEALAGGELKHGTLALIEKGVPCIAIAPRDKTYEKMISNSREIQARGGNIIGLSSESNDVFKYWIKTPDNPIAEIIPLQLLAYEMSVKRGYNPDMPRNLAKSVTVI